MDVLDEVVGFVSCNSKFVLLLSKSVSFDNGVEVFPDEKSEPSKTV